MASGTIMLNIGFPNYSDLITTLSTQGASYTATRNCWARVIVTATDAYMAAVFVGDKSVAGISGQSYTDLSAVTIVPIMKGQTISTRPSHGSYHVELYGCQ